MAQSLTQIYLHLVFSTKRRVPLLQDKTLREKVHAYLWGACKNLDSPSIAIGGIEDHVHVLCRQSKNQSVSNLVRESR